MKLVVQKIPLTKDLQNLKKLGLNGYISCQLTRVFLPCGFGMKVLADTLWNRECNFDMLAETYFNTLFGTQGSIVRQILELTGLLMHPECLRGEVDIRTKGVSDDFKTLRLESIKNQRNFLALSAKCEGTEAGLWQRLAYWSELCTALALVMRGHCNYYGISGNSEDIRSFHLYLITAVYRMLTRRSQKSKLTWDKFRRIWKEYVTPPRIYVDIWAPRTV